MFNNKNELNTFKLDPTLKETCPKLLGTISCRRIRRRLVAQGKIASIQRLEGPVWAYGPMGARRGVPGGPGDLSRGPWDLPGGHRDLLGGPGTPQEVLGPLTARNIYIFSNR